MTPNSLFEDSMEIIDLTTEDIVVPDVSVVTEEDITKKYENTVIVCLTSENVHNILQWPVGATRQEYYYSRWFMHLPCNAIAFPNISDALFFIERVYPTMSNDDIDNMIDTRVDTKLQKYRRTTNKLVAAAAYWNLYMLQRNFGKHIASDLHKKIVSYLII